MKARTVKKNKVAPPFRTVEFDIMYNEGISRTGDVLDLAVEEEIVTKRGAFYSYGDLRLAQGRENAKGYLTGNQAILGIHLLVTTACQVGVVSNAFKTHFPLTTNRGFAFNQFVLRSKSQLQLVGAASMFLAA